MYQSLTGRIKKLRLAAAITDDDDEDENPEAATLFSKRLNNFKKSPVKRGEKPQ